MENLDNVEFTEAQLSVVERNAQQGLRNQPPFNKRTPPVEELDLEKIGSSTTTALFKPEKITSQRTSLPRIAKQSDLADKGKGKEKSPIEDEAESTPDSKVEEDLCMAKEDEKRKTDLFRKRGEDTLRFNVVPGMKKFFFEGTHNWNFNEEKQFSLNRI
ncbi:hypothetical protein HAX54_053372 [Datura stramonium]|uniref:Uncharacterized protein n=1 Tax=Datura stramonium TaxID=4076 RepID=A0ABS8T096_DATST|nr:hypothetical protein [Datura stramonium]